MKTILVLVFASILAFGFIFTPTEGVKWETDFAASLQKAKKEKKMIFVNFTGSDWCGWCVKMDKDVFSQKEFIEYANKNLVCIKLDYPKRKKLSDAETKQNSELAKKYQVSGLPTYLLADASEKVILLASGYRQGGAQAYVDYLKAAIEAKKK